MAENVFNQGLNKPKIQNYTGRFENFNNATYQHCTNCYQVRFKLHKLNVRTKGGIHINRYQQPTCQYLPEIGEAAKLYLQTKEWPPTTAVTSATSILPKLAQVQNF